MNALVILVGLAVVALLGWYFTNRRLSALNRFAGVLHEREVALHEREVELSEQEVDFEKAHRLAWSVRKRFDQSIPGPDDEPVLYVLPGGVERTNSCEEARRAWMNVADEVRLALLEKGERELADKLDVTVRKPHDKLVELYDAKRKAGVG
jgi:hypothetical protein